MRPPLQLATGPWLGNDGNWSSFPIRIGIPEQYFDVLASFSQTGAVLPLPDVCRDVKVNLTNCGPSRGVVGANGTAVDGFEPSRSATWNNTDSEDLLDVQLQQGKWQSLSIEKIFGIDTAKPWLGYLGLSAVIATSDGKVDYTDKSVSKSSILQLVGGIRNIPSISFGYTAGAAYRNAPASLILGGYDTSRFISNDIHFDFDTRGTTPVTVNLTSLSLSTDTSSIPLLAGPVAMTSLDPTSTFLILPNKTCELFSETFGLSLDTASGLYLINETADAEWQQTKPNFTLSLKNANWTEETVDIVLPWESFVLTATYPYFETPTRYFPIRASGNETLANLGRVFFQEAYVIVDYERRNFTVLQTVSQLSSQSEIISIGSTVPVKMDLATKVLIGVLVGVLFLLLTGPTTFFYKRWMRIRRNRMLWARWYEVHQTDYEGDTPYHDGFIDSILRLDTKPKPHA